MHIQIQKQNYNSAKIKDPKNMTWHALLLQNSIVHQTNYSFVINDTKKN